MRESTDIKCSYVRKCEKKECVNNSNSSPLRRTLNELSRTLVELRRTLAELRRTLTELRRIRMCDIYTLYTVGPN
jgi:hypothetical protein